nr:MAG TPA: hypothetical protein [Caudoviricetes sp.]
MAGKSKGTSNLLLTTYAIIFALNSLNNGYIVAVLCPLIKCTLKRFNYNRCSLVASIPYLRQFSTNINEILWM